MPSPRAMKELRNGWPLTVARTLTRPRLPKNSAEPPSASQALRPHHGAALGPGASRQRGPLRPGYRQQVPGGPPGALKAAWRLGQMATEDYLRAVAGSHLPAGRDIDGVERDPLLAGCCDDDSPAGVRDAAVVALAYLSGLRRSELVGLQLADLELDPPSLRVLGKGGRQRLVPVPPPGRHSSRHGCRSGG